MVKSGLFFVFLSYLLAVNPVYAQERPVFIPDYMNYSAFLDVKVPYAEHQLVSIEQVADTITWPGFTMYLSAIVSRELPIPDGTPKNAADKGAVELIVYESDTVETESYLYGSDSITLYKCLPILIVNTSADAAVLIATGDYPELFLEAQSEKGEWYGVEQPLRGNKGTTRRFLPPGYLVISSGFLYKGDFETNLRYRLGDNVSAVFRGWIKRQWIP